MPGKEISFQVPGEPNNSVPGWATSGGCCQTLHTRSLLTPPFDLPYSPIRLTTNMPSAGTRVQPLNIQGSCAYVRLFFGLLTLVIRRFTTYISKTCGCLTSATLPTSSLRAWRYTKLVMLGDSFVRFSIS